MRTDTALIEAYLDKDLSAEQQKEFDHRKSSDKSFRFTLLFQAKVRLAALMYGRLRREADIMAASELAFTDPKFRQEITAIFK